MKNSHKNLILIVLFVFVLGVTINVSAETATCTGVFDQEFLNAMNDYVYVPIKWITPALLLVLTSFDFAKVVFAGKKEEMDKAKNNFLKRTIAAFIIFFAPDIIKLIVNFIQNRSIASCMNSF